MGRMTQHGWVIAGRWIFTVGMIGCLGASIASYTGGSPGWGTFLLALALINLAAAIEIGRTRRQTQRRRHAREDCW